MAAVEQLINGPARERTHDNVRGTFRRLDKVHGHLEAADVEVQGVADFEYTKFLVDEYKASYETVRKLEQLLDNKMALLSEAHVTLNEKFHRLRKPKVSNPPPTAQQARPSQYSTQDKRYTPMDNLAPKSLIVKVDHVMGDMDKAINQLLKPYLETGFVPQVPQEMYPVSHIEQ